MLRLKLNYVSKRGPRLRPQLHGQYLTHDIFICVSFNENQLTWLQMPLRFVVKGPIYSNTKVQEMAWHHAIIWSKVDTDIWRHGTLDHNMVMGNYVCVLILRRQHHVFSSRNLMQRWNLFQDDFIKRKHYPRYWPFVRRIHRSRANSPHKERPVTWSFDVFFDLCLNKQLNTQSWGLWFEIPSHPLSRQSNDITIG